MAGHFPARGPFDLNLCSLGGADSQQRSQQQRYEHHIPHHETMASQSTEATEPQLPTFRPGKKRKAYRQRATGDETEPKATPVATDASLTTSEQISALISEVQEETAANDESRPVSEVLRLNRNARHKARLGGVAFRAGSTPRAEEDAPTPTNNTEQSLVPAPDPIVAGIRNRFAPQTGMVGELINKHM